jgi:hypothetical protein
MELDRLRAELENQRQDTQSRRRFSEQIFQYLLALSLFSGLVSIVLGGLFRNFPQQQNGPKT